MIFPDFSLTSSMNNQKLPNSEKPSVLCKKTSFRNKQPELLLKIEKTSSHLKSQSQNIPVITLAIPTNRLLTEESNVSIDLSNRSKEISAELRKTRKSQCIIPESPLSLLLSSAESEGAEEKIGLNSSVKNDDQKTRDNSSALSRTKSHRSQSKVPQTRSKQKSKRNGPQINAQVSEIFSTVKQPNKKCVPSINGFISPTMPSSARQHILNPFNSNRPADWKEMAAERLIIQEELKNIYKCIYRVVLREDLTLILQNRWLMCRELKNSEETSKELKNALDFIYGVINKALFFGIYLFFDGEGYINPLKNIDKLVQKKYSKETGIVHNEIRHLLYMLYKKDFPNKLIFQEEEAEYIKRLGSLKLPAQCKFERNEKYCAFLLQRLYPLREPLFGTNEKDKIICPVMPLKTFMVAYKDNFFGIENSGIENLFNIIEYLLNLPEKNMPYRQKIILLDFCKSLLLNEIDRRISYSDVHIEEIREHKTRSEKEKKIREKLVIKLTNNNDRVIANLCEEIEYLATDIQQTHSYSIEKPLDVKDSIEAILSNDITADDFRNLVDTLSNDLKIHAALIFKSLTFDECLRKESKKITEIVNYLEKIEMFIKSLFLEILTKHMEKGTYDSADIHLDFFHLFNLFLQIANTSINIHDYFSAITIYSTLLLDRHLQKALKNKKFPKISSELNAIIDSLDSYYGNDSKFKKLNQAMRECQSNCIFYVPYFGLINSRIIKKMEEVDCITKANHSLPLQKYYMISQLMIDINETFDDIRFKIDAIEGFPIKSNISYLIHKTEMSEEDREDYENRFTAFFNKLNP